MKLFPMQRFGPAILLCSFAIGYSYLAHASTLHVPSEFATIQSAVNAAVDGDTILVAPGTYYENLVVDRTAIHLRSEAGPVDTIIDGSDLGQVVRVGAVSSFIIEGFTIQKGNPGTSSWPAGVWIDSSIDVTIRNNIVRDNSCSSCVGVGIGITGYIPAGIILIEGNVIEDNYAPGCGGAIGVSTSLNLEIANNIVRNNQCNVGGGIYLRPGSGNVVIKNNGIQNNTAILYGGGIWSLGRPITVTQNLITENAALSGGGVYTDVENLRGNATHFANNTIANNFSPTGSEIYLIGDTFFPINDTITLINNSISNDSDLTSFFCDLTEPPVLVLTSNNVYSAAGSAYGGSCSDMYTGVNGNISEDPLYLDPATGNYRLSPYSPLVDAGNNSAPNIPAEDLDGLPRIIDGNGDGLAVIDIGAYESQVFAAPALIDIKPGNALNTINPRATGAVWLAVLADSNLDPLQIDVSTARFGPDEAEVLRHRVKDVNKDGIADLLLSFKISESGIACGDMEATLTGHTIDGMLIAGTDSISTVGCNRLLRRP